MKTPSIKKLSLTKRFMALTGLTALLLWTISSTGLAVDRSLLSVPKQINGLGVYRQAGARGLVPVLLSTKEGQAIAVARTVQRMGGKALTVLTDSDFVVAQVPPQALQDLERSPQVRALAVDRAVRLDPLAMQPLSDKAQTVPSDSDPALSLKVTRSEIRAPQFAERTGTDGSSALIAVLDTGVDPGHPALQRTPDGSVKVIDWQDFTGEGDVATKETRTQPIPGIPSQSGVYHLGTFKESQIPQGEMGSDINRNGKNTDAFKILVTDAARKGVYDTVYVDTNGNGDFTDEQPMPVYNQGFTVGTFGSREIVNGAQQGVNFVVTRIEPDGSAINLGYDGGEHGTHVAGIAAGNGPITGIAPGARIMAIKVLTSGGSGEWAGIIAGMHYAATHGAKVINMSLGGMAELNDGSDPQSLFINDLTRKRGVLFSIAAGNSGPGLNTVGLPGVASGAITSGAFISSNTFRVDYGLTVPQDGLWYFSSAGPRDDGGLKPNIVSPGTANSAVPPWAGQYKVFQGTSMATPQTTGAAALLIAAAQARDLKVTPEQVRMALEMGARRLPEYGWYEQGHGLIQVDAAWEALQRLVREWNPDLVSFGRAKDGTLGTGLYARGFSLQPGEPKWVLGNREFRRQALDLSYLPGSGLTIAGPQSITLPSLQRKEIPLQLDYSATPGVYDALIQARLPGQVAYASEYLATVVVPYEFDPAKGNIINGMEGVLAPARYTRHFVRVPAGTAELTVNLSVPNNAGRVRIMLSSPDGMPVGTGSPWAGAPSGPERQAVSIQGPQPGVWEIDAYASHGGMNYGLAENHYVIDVAARGVFASPARLNLPQAFGQTQTRRISFTNDYDDIRAVVSGAGFVQPKSERMEVEHGNFKDRFFDVPAGTAILRAAIAQVDDPTADLTIALYYNDPRAGGWTPVGESSGYRINRQVQLLAPAAGQYAVEIAGKSVPAGKTGFTYSLTEVRGGSGVAAQDGGSATDRGFGSRWATSVTFKVPPEIGPYLGAVTVTDEKSGRVLTVIPVEVK